MANLPRKKYSLELKGITGAQWVDCGIVNASLSPWFDDNNQIRLFKTFVVMKKLPTVQKTYFSSNIQEFQHLTKADPHFNRAGGTDILLGIDTWTDIILEQIIRSKIGLVAQATQFGFAVFGTIQSSEAQSLTVSMTRAVINDESSHCLNDLLKRFWEEEELPENTILSEAELRAEEIYKNTTFRADDGRYVVRLPLIDGNIELGDSRKTALERFYQLERRLNRNPDTKQKYVATMREYLKLGIMRLATLEERQAHGYYIPHHPVIKRFRIVYDGSCITTNGKSVNDIQLAGPNLQEKLAFVISLFRFHRYVLSADIKKMYLQIRVNDEDLKYQKIFWRFSNDEPLQEYVLVRVTFGMKCSPYLANKSMLDMAERYKQQFPLASRATADERYVDDYMSGSDTIEGVVELYHQLKAMLSKAKFELGKWKTNSPEIVSLINQDLSHDDEPLSLNDDETSILGLKWQPSSDCFIFKIDEQWNSEKKVTKRTISSAISRIYDPCGFLAPIVIKAKSFFQELWKIQVGWDEPLNSDITNRWRTFYDSLNVINELKIPRWIQTTKGREVELIGFADASIIGYGAVLYIKCSSGQTVWCNLLASKTKVAPVKTLTIPRLELSAAVMLARLMNIYREKCKLQYVPYHCFSDSNITLSWIASCPSTLKIYVGARVKTIQKKTHKECWSYVPSKQNPADIASRGMQPTELINCSLWWHGPEFVYGKLEQKIFAAPELTDNEKNAMLSECKPIVSASLHVNKHQWLSINDTLLIERFSDLSKVVRITAYVQQAVKRFQRKFRAEPETNGLLSACELNSAVTYWIKFTQSKNFHEELNSLRAGSTVSRKSRLIQLCPFLDKEGVMRLRGRLENANVTYDEKHPIILPSNSTFSRLLLQEAHRVTLHGGTQLMLHYIRAKYWMIGARVAAASVSRRCGRCCRYMKNDRVQLMADLPKERLTNSRPFTHCGVDYFGPIKIKRFEGRCRTIESGYGAVFVCMTTRMVHIECVSDMTTTRFLWALARLAAIYQMPDVMFSDNAKTFQGAENELIDVLKTWQSKDIEDFITAKGIKWKFITPRAPNHGGLWEASVKSAKHHMKRMLNGHVLTFERMQTLFANISAVLNSRPLVPLTDDPLELNYLTPSHAMIGDRVVQPLSHNLKNVPINRVTQQKVIDKIHQDFWNVWRKEYIGSLQTRYKWNTVEGNLQVNDLVLLKEDNVPPGVWPVARVMEVYPGADGIVRSVKIRTPKSDLERPISKLVKLFTEPINNEEPINNRADK